MPTYTYECKKCTHDFELFHSMSAKPSVKCPECGSVCRRLIGKGAGVIFKGSGFYETDYKSKSGTPDSKSGGSAKSESKAESKSESKSESKPKSESKSDHKSEHKSSSKGTAKAASKH